IRNYDRKHLSSTSQRCWSFMARTGAGQHDVCASQVHLNATHRLAIAVVLNKTEYPREPITSTRYIAVNEVWKYGIDWDRAVIHSSSMRREDSCCNQAWVLKKSL